MIDITEVGIGEERKQETGSIRPECTVFPCVIFMCNISKGRVSFLLDISVPLSETKMVTSEYD